MCLISWRIWNTFNSTVYMLRGPCNADGYAKEILLEYTLYIVLCEGIHLNIIVSIVFASHIYSELVLIAIFSFCSVVILSKVTEISIY